MQNNKRYWLRGGLWLSSIMFSLCLFLVLVNFGANIIKLLGIPDVVIQLPIIIFYIVSILPILFLSEFFGLRSIMFDSREPLPWLEPSGWFFLVVIWFIVGSILGYLYGKIKNRKKITV